MESMDAAYSRHTLFSFVPSWLEPDMGTDRLEKEIGKLEESYVRRLVFVVVGK